MPMVQEYKIVRCDTLASLEESVNTYLSSGWKLNGGPLSYTIGTMVIFAQSLYRDIEVPGAWG